MFIDSAVAQLRGASAVIRWRAGRGEVVAAGVGAIV